MINLSDIIQKWIDENKLPWHLEPWGSNDRPSMVLRPNSHRHPMDDSITIYDKTVIIIGYEGNMSTGVNLVIREVLNPVHFDFFEKLKKYLVGPIV